MGDLEGEGGVTGRWGGGRGGGGDAPIVGKGADYTRPSPPSTKKFSFQFLLVPSGPTKFDISNVCESY